MADFEEFLVLPIAHQKADPSWFAFPITVKETAPFDRHELTRFLEYERIETRPLFAGNIIKQPAYRTIAHRTIGELRVTDQIMESTFFIGIFPGNGPAQIDYIAEAFRNFCSQY